MPSSIHGGEDRFLPFVIPQTELLAGTTIEVICPVAGFVRGLSTIVQTAITTGGDVTLKVGTTDVTGLSITVADAATKGTVQSDTPTAGTSTAVVTAGQRLQVVPSAAFNTAGALNGHIWINTFRGP
jgi:hypothetical protein